MLDAEQSGMPGEDRGVLAQGVALGVAVAVYGPHSSAGTPAGSDESGCLELTVGPRDRADGQPEVCC